MPIGVLGSKDASRIWEVVVHYDTKVLNLHTRVARVATPGASHIGPGRRIGVSEGQRQVAETQVGLDAPLVGGKTVSSQAIVTDTPRVRKLRGKLQFIPVAAQRRVLGFRIENVDHVGAVVIDQK